MLAYGRKIMILLVFIKIILDGVLAVSFAEYAICIRKTGHSV